MKKGYYGIGIEGSKFDSNIGTLFRSALIMGADFIFTIGKRYKTQCTDTPKSIRHLPCYHYKDFTDFYKHMPQQCRLVGVELDENADYIEYYNHPKSCIYLLGAEDKGLSEEALDNCDDLIKIHGDISLNVSVAGSIIMYDRMNKLIK